MAQFFSTLFSGIPGPIAGVLMSIAQVWSVVWWIVLPIVTGIIFWEAWLLYLHVEFIHNIKWKVLEIKVPKNVLKTPKAMEQIFAAAHAPYSYGIRFWDKYWKGVHEDFFVFDIVGKAGETHFYLRTPEKYRHMMESAIYGQYPEAQVTEVEDYIKQMPAVLPNKDFDVAGFEEVFGRPDYYPLRTYPMFEETIEERRVDPIGSLVEAMSKMTGDQQFWFQLVLVPAGEEWVKEGQHAVKKLLGIEEKEEKKGGIFPDFDLGISLGEALRGPFEHPGEASSHGDKNVTKTQRFLVSPSDKEAAEGISKKVAKFGFETTIRFMFIERRGESPTGVDKQVFLAHGYIRQFNTQDMNTLRPDKKTTSASYAVHGFFKKTRVRLRKRLLYERYTHFSENSHKPVLNIEELATLYHFPTGIVSTTELDKVESRKGTPPGTLPVIEE